MSKAEIAEEFPDSTDIAELKDSSGNYKETATLAEIAECWTHDSPEEKDEVTLNLFVRARDNNFQFKNPEEMYVAPDEVLVLGTGMKVNGSDIGTLCYRLSEAIEHRCREAVVNNVPLKPFDYNAALSSLNELDRSFDRDCMWQIMDAIAKDISLLIYDPNNVKGSPQKQFENRKDALTSFLEEGGKEKELSDKEITQMKLTLAKFIGLERKAFLHWLRLGFHTEKGSVDFNRGNYFLSLEYNGFWGDPWQGQPENWNEDINDTDGLILRDAYKYYNDPHLWAEYEDVLEEIDKAKKTLRCDDNVEQLDNDMKAANEKLLRFEALLQDDFLAHFHPNNSCLIAQGYFDKTTPETITYAQLKDMFDGDKIIVEGSSGKIGQMEVTSIRVYKTDRPIDGHIDWKSEYEQLKQKHENTYTTPYLDIMKEAITHFSITKSNQPMKEDLVDWFKEKIPNVSGNIAKSMATLVRSPEMQKGGYYKGNKQKGDTQNP